MNRIAKFCAHLGVVFCAFIAAYELRRALPVDWWFTNPEALRVLGWAALYAGIAGVLELVTQTERGAWRFASASQAVVLLRNSTITALAFILIIFITDRGVDLPRSVLVLAWLLSFLFLVGLRLSWRMFHDPALAAVLVPRSWRSRPRSGQPLVLVGPLVAAERHLRHLMSDPDAGYWPEVIVSSESHERGLQIHNVPSVSGLEHLEKVLDASRQGSAPVAAILFLADPVGDLGLGVERIGHLRSAGHPLLRPQPIAGLGADEAAPAGRLREIALEEFLQRAPVRLDPAPLRRLVENRRVMVTGAGGSIGSELVRQLVGLGCSHIAMVDHSEFLLFEIDRELAEANPQVSRRARLADVRDEARVVEIMREERPELVFHAAALKHVAMVESNPAEGVLTNVLGTWNVLRSAIDAGATQFVLISTDKAVAPTNVMGATKRIAETLLELVPQDQTLLSAVRFGNVLGSAGSVVPIFRRQIARGGPVTVTHPDVDRFFMTIPEAVQLVLHSAAVKSAQGSQALSKFLLEMGEPVKIADLAKQMIELSGKVPGTDIAIEFTGLHPGEKLTEILFDEGEEVLPCVDGVMEIQPRAASCTLTVAAVRELICTAQEKNDQGAREAVERLVNCIRDVDAKGGAITARPAGGLPASS